MVVRPGHAGEPPEGARVVLAPDIDAWTRGRLSGALANSAGGLEVTRAAA